MKMFSQVQKRQVDAAILYLFCYKYFAHTFRIVTYLSAQRLMAYSETGLYNFSSRHCIPRNVTCNELFS